MEANADRGVSREDLSGFNQLTPILKDVKVTDGDYKVVMDKLRDRDDYLIFLDPPYIDSNIYTAEFGDDKHIELMESAMGSSSLVMICGTDNSLYNKLITDGGFNKYFVGTINKRSAAKSNATQDEYVWCNFEIPSFLLPFKYKWVF